ncbi:hypothetical protein A2U01_0094698, partial [Trifolium medium]|nr:hypothetical protein [Trifolium medium]
VERIRVLGQDVLDGVKFGFDNVVAQLKVLNPGIELNIEGMSMLKKVENGHLVILVEYEQMVNEEDDGEEEELGNDEQQG